MSQKQLNAIELAGYIEHTILKADALERDIERICREAGENHFFAVCVAGSWVSRAAGLLSGTGVRVVSVAGFPLGNASTETKCFETVQAIDSGAYEMDVVINIGRFKEGNNAYVERELREIVHAAEGHTIKVILETCLLTCEEKIRACRLVGESGAGFVKTSTGLSSGGATVADVELLRASVESGIGVKASGGIRDAAAALALIRAGAERLGTSYGIAIVQGLPLD
ncbi:MAG: deoxyribose-phosphate aldolase [Acidobacteriota bacterium]